MIPHRHLAGLSRRELLQAGYSGLLGLGLPSLLAGRARAAEASAPTTKRGAKSLVIVFLTGAASHHDTFDMKLDAPAEIRGEFQPIATSVPGYQICEHLPQLAARAHKYAVVRTFSHNDNNHLMSTHHVLTGEKQPGGFFDKVASRDDWPSYSAALSFLRPRNDGLPSGVNLPTFLREGPLTWPGQHAGFLGLLDETLVMMLGEFGRTPKINNTRGRDHWGPCFFGVFAGAGVRPGQVIGRSDSTGAYPVTRAFSPHDIAATVYHLLGIPPEAEVRDRLGRPVLLNRGDVIDPLFTGAAV